MHEITFVIDCKGTQSCKHIRKYMKEQGFEVSTIGKTWLGDHKGVKTFKTHKKADEEANSLIEKYHDKMWQVTVQH